MENLLTCNFVKYIIYYKIIHVMFFTVWNFFCFCAIFIDTNWIQQTSCWPWSPKFQVSDEFLLKCFLLFCLWFVCGRQVF